MRRRPLLATLGTVFTSALAGCSSATTDTPTEGNRDDNTPTDTPTGTSTDTPTDTPTPRPEPELTVLGHEMVTFEGEYGDEVYVKATIENTGDAYSGMVEPEAVFLDENGEELETSSVSIIGLPPGDTWETFVQFLGDGSPSDHNFDLAHDSSLVPEYGVEGARVLESSLDATGDVKINGVVENTGEGTIDYLEAIPRFYAANGNLLWIGLSNVTDLGAGQTWDFSNRLVYSNPKIAGRVADHTVSLKT